MIKKLDKLLTLLNVALNAVPHYAKRKSPAFVLFGHEIPHPLWISFGWTISPLEICKETCQEILKTLNKMPDRYNKNIIPCQIKIGDIVLCRKITQNKKVPSFLTYVTVNLVDPSINFVVQKAHISDVKLYLAVSLRQ
ncbi:hypothetical protein PR048_017956 [Dryococelus australis]|uniref:Uncharacterized protein n=1 Tax=Dryococelus australis TaxID=614101 RepID=A0ABQ9HAZ5_9NEOP|nr:hypothetical protein PR048_017956 [Dryococelus australis]